MNDKFQMCVYLVLRDFAALSPPPPPPTHKPALHLKINFFSIFCIEKVFHKYIIFNKDNGKHQRDVLAPLLIMQVNLKTTNISMLVTNCDFVFGLFSKVSRD